jgi:hypothetical protein
MYLFCRERAWVTVPHPSQISSHLRRKTSPAGPTEQQGCNHPTHSQDQETSERVRLPHPVYPFATSEENEIESSKSGAGGRRQEPCHSVPELWWHARLPAGVSGPNGTLLLPSRMTKPACIFSPLVRAEVALRGYVLTCMLVIMQSRSKGIAF